jgi:hypothetical protein
MPFDRSQLIVLDTPAWRYTTPPTYDAQGRETAPGVRQQLNGVFILLAPGVADELEEALTPAMRDEWRGWFLFVTSRQAAEWHVPVWAGEQNAFYIRVPAAVWADPSTPPPLKVKRYLGRLFRE